MIYEKLKEITDMSRRSKLVANSCANASRILHAAKYMTVVVNPVTIPTKSEITNRIVKKYCHFLIISSLIKVDDELPRAVICAAGRSTCPNSCQMKFVFNFLMKRSY